VLEVTQLNYIITYMLSQ